MIRDQDALAEVGIPVFSAGIRPSGPDKAGPGSVGLPIWIGGQRCCAGDVVVGDSDGVVIVPQHMLSDAAMILDQIAEKEAGMEEDGKVGKLSPRNIDSFLSGVQINYID